MFPLIVFVTQKVMLKIDKSVSEKTELSSYHRLK